jgi:hypothetical protein
MKAVLFSFVVFFGIISNLSADTTSENSVAHLITIKSQKKTKLYINSDLSGGVNSDFYIRSSRVTSSQFRCSLALFAFYKVGAIGIGLGARLGLEQNSRRINRTFLRRTSSLGLAINYQYGSKSFIQYQFIGRAYYSFYYSNNPSNTSNQYEKSEGFSGIIGWGPVVKISNILISPVINLDMVSKNTNMLRYGDYYLKSGFLLNLSIPIK